MKTPESAAALATQVYRLRQDLGDLAETVRAHVEAEEARAAQRAAPVWADLTREEFDGQLARLGEWVNGHLRAVYPTYWRDVLQDCWPNHPEALHELGNLWAEWTRIYDRNLAELAGALNWHDRWMPGTRARLKPVMSGCVDGCARTRAAEENGRMAVRGAL